MEEEAKKAKVIDLWYEVAFLDNLVFKFFDTESNEKLDEKIDVLTKLRNGVAQVDIPNFYDILEKYPKGDNVWWGP